VFTPGPGAVVEDRYELTRVIGRGGMGEIWEAHDRQLEGPCAIKFILQHLANDKEVRSRFAREAKAVARLRTPHAVHIFSVGEEQQTPYLAMELLQGETLYTVLERTGRLSQGITLSVIEQIAEALTVAHQHGIVHRDLKPDNVWLCAGSRVFVKVLDFGVAKVGLGTATLRTATGSLVGTPNYMSPEQARGNRNVDHRSDLWSLAVITIECLTGKRPFESAGLGDLLIQIVSSPVPRLTEFAPELPPGLQHWLDKALDRDPSQRFQSASAMVEAVKPYLLEGGVRPSSDDTFRPLQSSTAIGTLLRRMHPDPKKKRLRKGMWIGAAALGAAAIGGAAVLFSGSRDDQHAPAAQSPTVGTEALLPAQSVPAQSGTGRASSASANAAPPNGVAPNVAAPNVGAPNVDPAAGAPAQSTVQHLAAPVVRTSSVEQPASRVRLAEAAPRAERAKGKRSSGKAPPASELEDSAKPARRGKPAALPQLLDDSPAAATTSDKRLGL
jgi:eukaryotic-like serine/threonine-protein kinase